MTRARLSPGLAIGERLRTRRGELGTLRFALIVAAILLVIGGVVALLVPGEPAGTLRLLVNLVVTIWAAQRLLERPRPDWLWGLILAAGAAILWAQYFGLAPYPIQGA